MNPSDATVVTHRSKEVCDHLFAHLYTVPRLCPNYLAIVTVKTILCVKAECGFTVAVVPDGKRLCLKHHVLKDCLAKTSLEQHRPANYKRSHMESPYAGSVVTIETCIELKPGDKIWIRSDSGEALQFDIAIFNKPPRTQ